MTVRPIDSGRMTVFVIGTRAQLIKMAPVIKACGLIGNPCMLVMTGQHKDTLEDILKDFHISVQRVDVVEVGERATALDLFKWLPTVFLGLVRQLRHLKRAFGDVQVVVHGDTLSTIVGAMASRILSIPLFHVESGLTSGRLFSPFPEELTRQLVFRMSDVALCPDQKSTEYMARFKCVAVNTEGNTILDSLCIAVMDGGEQASASAPYLVISVHRFQNIYNRQRFCSLIDEFVAIAEFISVVFVLHPATAKRLKKTGHLERLSRTKNISLLPRLSYSRFIRLAASAQCVLTDGGSNQEELAALGTPTVVLRDCTERADGLGENAIMEGELPTGLSDWIRQSGFVLLRRASSTPTSLGPSARIAKVLAGECHQDCRFRSTVP